MDKLFLIIPFFGYNKAQLWIMEWVKKPSTRERLARMGFTPQIHLLNINQKLTEGIEIVGNIPKGKIIRLALEARKRDRADYITCIDGDGQIPLDYVLDVCFQLKYQPIDAVLACRKHVLGVSGDRAIIEQFELFFIGQLYGTELPDGQCGLWGFKGDLLDRLNLSADSFEIELDFLTQLLHSNIPFGFIEVDIKESEKTTFDVSDHKAKITFMCNKLRIGLELVTSLVNRFEKLFGPQLPKSYKEMLFSLDEKDIPIQQSICFNGNCKKCKYRTM